MDWEKIGFQNFPRTKPPIGLKREQTFTSSVRGSLSLSSWEFFPLLVWVASHSFISSLPALAGQGSVEDLSFFFLFLRIASFTTSSPIYPSWFTLSFKPHGRPSSSTTFIQSAVSFQRILVGSFERVCKILVVTLARVFTTLPPSICMPLLAVLFMVILQTSINL